MELKTLKDLPWYQDDINQPIVKVRVDELRKEAIKHYKKEVDVEYHTEPKTAYDWIEEFFNITEDDLK